MGERLSDRGGQENNSPSEGVCALDTCSILHRQPQSVRGVRVVPLRPSAPPPRPKGCSTSTRHTRGSWELVFTGRAGRPPHTPCWERCASTAGCPSRNHFGCRAHLNEPQMLTPRAGKQAYPSGMKHCKQNSSPATPRFSTAEPENAAIESKEKY